MYTWTVFPILMVSIFATPFVININFLMKTTKIFKITRKGRNDIVFSVCPIICWVWIQCFMFFETDFKGISTEWIKSSTVFHANRYLWVIRWQIFHAFICACEDLIYMIILMLKIRPGKQNLSLGIVCSGPRPSPVMSCPLIVPDSSTELFIC